MIMQNQEKLDKLKDTIEDNWLRKKMTERNAFLRQLLDTSLRNSGNEHDDEQASRVPAVSPARNVRADGRNVGYAEVRRSQVRPRPSIDDSSNPTSTHRAGSSRDLNEQLTQRSPSVQNNDDSSDTVGSSILRSPSYSSSSESDSLDDVPLETLRRALERRRRSPASADGSTSNKRRRKRNKRS